MTIDVKQREVGDGEVPVEVYFTGFDSAAPGDDVLDVAFPITCPSTIRCSGSARSRAGPGCR